MSMPISIRSPYNVIINKRSFVFYIPMNDYSKNEELAQYIAHALDDIDSIIWHRKMVRLHPKEFLLQKLNHVLSRPDHKIDTTRARLYNTLVNNGPSRQW